MDVPRAISTACCVAVPVVVNAYTRTGTMIRPPPMPNKPAKNPDATPLNTHTAKVSSLPTLASIVGARSPLQAERKKAPIGSKSQQDPVLLGLDGLLALPI